MTKKINKPPKTEQGGIPIALYLPNLIGYLRFFLIVGSWPFALSEPRVFAILYATSYALAAIDGPLAKILNQQSFYGAQLDILMSRFATSSLIFAVLKLGLAYIFDEYERMQYAFFFGCMFLSDFVSYWFQVYSAYLLDEEPHKTPNVIVQTILYILSLPIISLVMTALSEFYVFNVYIGFFKGQFPEITNNPLYPLITQLAVFGAILKHTHNILHLVVSSVRIVKLDVNQKNSPPAKKIEKKKKL